MDKKLTTLTKDELANLKGGEWEWDEDTHSWVWVDGTSGNGGEGM